ncbi:hypothetical protein HGRIS_010446 [Hohenbuehelia grisea]|uniref:Uncharacterized protein n=1 Tax=Hohenbuehelia grisea TaxID=104357 RepID=A0ABR3J0I5_9AGAR
MFALRTLFVALAAASVLANPLEVRQTTNTNPRIQQIIDVLDQSLHISGPNIVTIIASQTDNDQTITPQINDMVKAFNTSATDLNATPISSGSTATSPTNDELSVIFGDSLYITITSVSGLIQSDVPSLTSILAPLDTAMAASVTAFNRTLPGGLNLVHILMLDAQQFLTRQGLTKTRTALGFT